MALPTDAALPLADLKVLDFSWAGVGPITVKYLADHGATVVRVESHARYDVVRLGPPWHDGKPGIERSQFYASYNTSKLGLALDLSKPEARAIARRLAAWADVVVESYTPRVMRAFGLAFEDLRAVNPRLVMLSTCLQGQTGPYAEFPGFGQLAAALSGFYEIAGWADRAPAPPYGAYTDYVVPRLAATALLAAVDHQRRTGEGQHLDVSQVEAALHFLAPRAPRPRAHGPGRDARREPERPRRAARRLPVRGRRPVDRAQRAWRGGVARAVRRARRARLARGCALLDARRARRARRGARRAGGRGDALPRCERARGPAAGGRDRGRRRRERARPARRSRARRLGLLPVARASGAPAGALRGPRAAPGGDAGEAPLGGAGARRAHRARAARGARHDGGRDRAADRRAGGLVARSRAGAAPSGACVPCRQRGDAHPGAHARRMERAPRGHGACSARRVPPCSYARGRHGARRALRGRGAVRARAAPFA